ncbi:NADP-specific glutamate dehydrogenase [Babesia caballi]|uniref:glutamate dehydrogenase (NADP(+)) n=1 Tax=Babesia caballi TaxID=5871 RepID=A0AAV4LSJ5_BABCB|nr:NADP-specific glutamate dehydrogenase [Babesia caballi]
MVGVTALVILAVSLRQWTGVLGDGRHRRHEAVPAHADGAHTHTAKAHTGGVTHGHADSHSKQPTHATHRHDGRRGNRKTGALAQRVSLLQAGPVVAASGRTEGGTGAIGAAQMAEVTSQVADDGQNAPSSANAQALNPANQGQAPVAASGNTAQAGSPNTSADAQNAHVGEGQTTDGDSGPTEFACKYLWFLFKGCDKKAGKTQEASDATQGGEAAGGDDQQPISPVVASTCTIYGTTVLSLSDFKDADESGWILINDSNAPRITHNKQVNLDKPAQLQLKATLCNAATYEATIKLGVDSSGGFIIRSSEQDFVVFEMNTLSKTATLKSINGAYQDIISEVSCEQINSQFIQKVQIRDTGYKGQIEVQIDGRKIISASRLPFKSTGYFGESRWSRRRRRRSVYIARKRDLRRPFSRADQRVKSQMRPGSRVWLCTLGWWCPRCTPASAGGRVAVPCVTRKALATHMGMDLRVHTAGVQSIHEKGDKMTLRLDSEELRARVEALREHVRRRDPEQPEFLQAFDEVLESLTPVFEEDARYLEVLKHVAEPERAIVFRVTWTNDAGETVTNRGFRVQFSSVLGPYKGGLRFHPRVNMSVLKFLGFEQIFKNSLTGLNMGGAKGGSDFDPSGKSDNEVRAFCQAFMTELHRHIGADTDVPAGDIGVGAREVGYLFGQYRRLRNGFDGALTGKGLEWGGSQIRPEATGYGAVYFATAVLEDRMKEGIAGKRCLVSGSGNVAQYAAEKLIDLGAIPVTLSDSSGYVYEPAGFTKEQLAVVMRLKNPHRKRLSEYLRYSETASFHAGEKPWGVAADVAFPCAMENEILADDARRLVAAGVKLVVEGANMPTHSEAVKLLKAGGVVVCPGKAANAGGVLVSGLEMAQNSQRVRWSREEVDARLREIMFAIYGQCRAASARYGVEGDLVAGANIAGFLRVAGAFVDQGYL